MQGNEDAQNEYLDVSRMNKKKKRKEHNEENEKLVIEQEREMKKLENSLFGSQYSPVEFGKEDKEEIQDKLEKENGAVLAHNYKNVEAVENILQTNENLVGGEKLGSVFEVSTDSSTIAFVGNEGYILLVSTKTKELIGTLKMNGTARSLAFADDGQQLLSSGGDGQVYHWDLRKRVCFHKAVDAGCINGTSLSTSPNGKLFAAGSDSGIVNVYNREEFLGGKRKPIKTIENLTTKVDFLKFNNDAQILAISSSMKKNSLKLIHVPSFTVFSNWPPLKKSLQYPLCLDFSPGGGFMAMGNAGGKVLLHKQHHYNHA
ncbi:hypothetical protein CMV_010632 [Castanea mollissima]|uniref:Uncharacterized protein n=1 Tax=Castanea mollissima TaxID=60419 RepID=A0A8J4RIT2_9ROSI|nr:hypothetical protein CMV_010632 [Castanea mollissima]